MVNIKKILIIFGGVSSEHTISIKSAKSVYSNVDPNLFETTLVGIDKKGKWYEYNDDIIYLDDWTSHKCNLIDNIIEYLKQFDVIFPLLHGSNGEDGKLQGMFEMFNLNYVGCDTLTSSILMDKDISKALFKSFDIPVVPSVTLYKNKKIKLSLNYPLIVKPANGGSSIGITKANNKKELKKALNIAFNYDDKVLIEEFKTVRELEVAILKTSKEFVVSNIGEIKPSNEFYDYNAKYENNLSITTIAHNLDKDIEKKIKNYCNILVNRLNIKGLSRIDFFLDNDNNIYLNEINTIPGFTNISMYPKLLEGSGISYQNLITKLLTNTF